MINVENHLAEHCHIREDITLFVTTSKNMEGINIEDEDIRHVYIESHSLTDITQMAGRIRLGAEHAYIILDSNGYRDSEPPYERTFARMCAIPEKSNDNSSASQLNRNLQRFCSQINISDFVGNPTSSIKAYNTVKPELGKFIDHVKNQSEYYQFDYIRNKFFYNVYRESSIDFINDEWRKFYVAKSSDSLLSLFQCTFPHSCLHPILSPEEDATACFLRYLDQHQETQHHVNDLLAIIYELAKILGEPKRQKQNLHAE